VLAIAPSAWTEFRALCERERCPFAVLGVATEDGQLGEGRPLRQQAGGHADGSAARQAAEDAPRRARQRAHLPPLDLAGVDLKGGRAARAAPAGGGLKNFLITIGDRTSAA
jgi:phosphoribosylformylglycinamidine synthase